MTPRFCNMRREASSSITAIKHVQPAAHESLQDITLLVSSIKP